MSECCESPAFGDGDTCCANCGEDMLGDGSDYGITPLPPTPVRVPEDGLDAYARLHQNLAEAPADAEKCFVSLDYHRALLLAKADDARRIGEAREAFAAIMDVGGEINPSNYNHEDVCSLNNAFIEQYQIAEAALAALNNGGGRGE